MKQKKKKKKAKKEKEKSLGIISSKIQQKMITQKTEEMLGLEILSIFLEKTFD